MLTIHKYELQPRAGVQNINVRKDAKLLKVTEQLGKIYVWFEVDLHQSWEQVSFVSYETGAELEVFHSRCEYVDTLFLAGSSYVLHVYKVKP